MTLTTKTDVLFFLKTKKLLQGTIHIRYLIYLKAIYGQKMKEIDFSTLGQYFLTVALKNLLKEAIEPLQRKLDNLNNGFQEFLYIVSELVLSALTCK